MNLQAWWQYQRARILLFLRRRDQAINALDRVLALAPGNALAAASLGYLHGENGDYRRAEDYFRRTIELQPADADMWFNLGYVLQKQDRQADAVVAFDSAIEKRHSLDRAWFGKGMSLAALKRHTEAIAAFERAAELQPMNPHALYELGIQHHVLGQRDALARVIEKLRGFDPKATRQLLDATRDS